MKARGAFLEGERSPKIFIVSLAILNVIDDMKGFVKGHSRVHASPLKKDFRSHLSVVLVELQTRIMPLNFSIIILTWFSPRRVANRRHFVAVPSSARRSTSPARSHACAFRGDLATLFSLHTADGEASIVSLTADWSSTVRKRFVLTIYLIFLILHSLVLQPTWPGRDIELSPRFPCERQCVTLDKLPMVSPKRGT